MSTPNSVTAKPIADTLHNVYQLFYQWELEAQAEAARAHVRACHRCGGDVHRDGDLLRCLNCDNAEPAEDALRADFDRLAGELGGVVSEE
jgi:hypothetical protein